MSPAAATLRADAVVVGSGAGGAPVAARLAEDGRDVVLLEAGPRLSAADFGPDEGAMRTRVGRMSATEDGAHSFYAGACVGGSTVVNDALCWRPPPEILEAWSRREGLAALRAEAFAPYVEQAWRDVHAEPTRRSHINRNARQLELAARRLGWRGEAMPRNVRGCARLGRCNLGCPIDAKQSTLVTYVPRAERAGARVVAGARVRRVEIAAGRVRAVIAERDGAPLRVETPLAVIAAGALETPAVLRRSGLDADTVGAGFQCHSSVYVTGRFAEPIHGYLGPTMAWAISEFSDVNGAEGPGFMLENSAVHPTVTAAALPGFGPEHARVMRALPHLAHIVVVLRDRTRGRVDVGDAGAARVGYALGHGDLERLRTAIGAAARAYLAAGALEVFLPLEGFGPVRREADLARLDDFPIDRSRLGFLYAVHLFGGAALGATSRRGACREDGAVWGVRGLYASDASTLPSNTGVNPQITVLANALRIADGLAAEPAA